MTLGTEETHLLLKVVKVYRLKPFLSNESFSLVATKASRFVFLSQSVSHSTQSCVVIVILISVRLLESR